MPGHPAHIGVDGHPVIVQNHDHRLVRGPGVIQSLEAQTAAQGSVADQGQHLIVLMQQRPGPCHAQGHGHGVGGVAGDEGIMGTLPRLGEAGEAVQLAQGAKQLPPPGEGLVDIALVSHVEHQTILRRVEYPVDGHRQLHHAQIGRQMPACP